MNKSKQAVVDPRILSAQAQRAASEKDIDKALCLFDACIQEYLKRQKSFKAVAVSRKAKTVLGPIPKVSALIIRMYTLVGLLGDAHQEYESAASLLKKNDLAFFQALDEEAFKDLLGFMDLKTYPKGRVVLKRHDEGNDIFIVLSGSCEVIRDARRLGVMAPGDLFGEIGFFAQTARSATVKTLEKSMLVRIPSDPLHRLKEQYPSLRQILEGIYSERILKKVTEDLVTDKPLTPSPEVITTIHYTKGQDIPVNPEDSMAIIKHGIVEVDYDDMYLVRKQYLKPGAVISHKRARARASTDVVILLTKAMHKAKQA